MSRDCGTCGRYLDNCRCTPADHNAESDSNTLEEISEKLDKIIKLLEQANR